MKEKIKKFKAWATRLSGGSDRAAYHLLPDSKQSGSLRSHKRVGRIDPEAKVTAAVILRSRKEESDIALMAKLIRAGIKPFLQARHLHKWFGARSEDLALVKRTVKEHGCDVKQSDSDRAFGILRVAGTARAIERLFNVTLTNYRSADGEVFRTHSGAVSVPKVLKDVVVHVARLDKRPVARTNFKQYGEMRPLTAKNIVSSLIGMHKGGKTKAPKGLDPRQIAIARGLKLDSKDVQKIKLTLAFISLGGGNGVCLDQSLEAACHAAGVHVPTLIREFIAGANEGDANDPATVENVLDLLTQALCNPNGTIIDFVAPNDDDSFVTAAETIVAYTKRKIDGFSISWGGPESSFPEASIARWKRVAQARDMVGMIGTAATGDNGAPDVPNVKKSKNAHAKKGKKQGAAPALPKYNCDCPAVALTGVGGTQITVSTDGKAVTRTVTWNDLGKGGGATGCGVSRLIGRRAAELAMATRLGIKLPLSDDGEDGHNVVVVADDAAPASGAKIFVSDGNGKIKVGIVGGTSFAAPLTVVLLAYVSALSGGIPDMEGFLYSHAGSDVFDHLSADGTVPPYSQKAKDPFGVLTGCGMINVGNAVMAASAGKHVRVHQLGYIH